MGTVEKGRDADGGAGNSPTISVVVPTHRRNELLAKCLERLAPGAQTLAFDQYEVIVTDDGGVSTAESLVRARFPWATWMRGPSRGPAANRNAGAARARGRWLGFIDDDCVPVENWLEGYKKAMAGHPDVQVFEGRVYADRARRSLAERYPGNETGGHLWACNFCVTRALFTSLGGFDERFPYAAMEDVEFKLRLNRAKQEFLFVREAAVCHPWRTISGWNEMKKYQRSALIYLEVQPGEAARINWTYYLRYTAHSIYRQLLPGLVRYRGAGLGAATLEVISNIQMAFRLFIRARAARVTPERNQ
jgi:GT2 family glycosyltransferase